MSAPSSPDPGSWDSITLEELRIIVRDLLNEVRSLENLLVAAIGADKVEAAAQAKPPARYKKYKHKDTGTKLCDTDDNPGPKWERICKTKTWSNQGECDRDTCT